MLSSFDGSIQAERLTSGRTFVVGVRRTRSRRRSDLYTQAVVRAIQLVPTDLTPLLVASKMHGGLTGKEGLIHVPSSWFDPFWVVAAVVRARAHVRSTKKLLHQLQSTHRRVAAIAGAQKLLIKLDERRCQIRHDPSKTILRLADWVLD